MQRYAAGRSVALIVLLIFHLLGAVGPASSQPRFKGERFPEDEFDLPEPPAIHGKPLRLWATWYRLYGTRESAGGIALLDMKGRAISRTIGESAFCHGAIAGTLRIVEHSGRFRTYNVAGFGEQSQVDCEKYLSGRTGAWVEKVGRSRFRAAKHAFGDGASGHALVPLRTIAVDKRLIPFGSVVYIPAARGLPARTPDGREVTHDGYFFAADSGGAVKGHHIDVFTGPIARNPFPTFIASTPHRRFDAYVVDDPAAREYLEGLHQRP